MPAADQNVFILMLLAINGIAYVDISSYIDAKVRANVANRGKGPARDYGQQLRRELARQGRKLALLGDSDASADFGYVKQFLMDDWKRMGALFGGLDYAEAFRYIGPEPNYQSEIMKYVDEHRPDEPTYC